MSAKLFFSVHAKDVRWPRGELAAITQSMPMTAEPSRPGFSGLDSTCNDPLSSWQLEALSDDLFTGAFHRTTANHEASRTEAVIAHAFSIGVEIIGSFVSF